jgi:hypothetical protein
VSRVSATRQRTERLLAQRPELPWSEWALTRDALRFVLDVLDRRPGIALECGSGVSTIAIARLLAERGEGSLYSLEHDPEWATLIRSRLADEGIGERATVLDAPLEPHPLVGHGGWYSSAALDRLPAAGVELLLVDGPPANDPKRERARYPALPELGPRLSATATVVLDDIGRDGERWVLRAWERQTELRFERLEALRIAVARVGATLALGRRLTRPSERR